MLLADQLQTKIKEKEDTLGALRAALAKLALADSAELEAIRLGPDLLLEFRQIKTRLGDRKVRIQTRIKTRQDEIKAHSTHRPVDLEDPPDPAALSAAMEAARVVLEQAQLSHRTSGDEMRAHAHAQQALASHRKNLEEAEEQARIWQTLHRCIGANNGSQFRQFAQSLNLGKLLESANVHLARLAERYRLIGRKVNGLPTLEFDLEDLDQAGAHVATRSLSGGERFLVSLALALGLSDFRRVKMPIETLLLDEGFGTLDPETLVVALNALSQLQSDGRQVGIISHVAGIREQSIPRIEVKCLGGGRSKVQTR